MNRIRNWGGAMAAAALCTACAHQMKTTTMAGSVAPSAAGSYDVQVWSGNKRAELPFPSQRVEMSLHWAEADEGIASWNDGFASNTQARQTVHVDHPHGMLHTVRVSLAGDPTQTGPALVIDSVGVTSEANGVRYVCYGGAKAANIRPGTSSDLGCRRR